MESYRRRKFNTSTRKYIGGEEAAVKAMKRLNQRMARQKMMIIRNIETECTRDELNQQIAVLQDLQRQYFKLELALQSQTNVLSPVNKHPLSEELAAVNNENQLFLDSSIENFRGFNNVSSGATSNQQSCSKSLSDKECCSSERLQQDRRFSAVSSEYSEEDSSLFNGNYNGSMHRKVLNSSYIVSTDFQR